MRTNRFNFALASGLLAVAALACSATTANISSFKIGKDKEVSQEASSFGPNDPVYGVATISNNPGKVKVKGRVLVEDVQGQQPGPVPGAEKTLDLDGSGTATYSYTPPSDGWPKGKYKFEVIMTNEAGEQKDQKSASFTVQ